MDASPGGAPEDVMTVGTATFNSMNPTGAPLPVTLDVSNPSHFREPTILSKTDYVTDSNNATQWQVISAPSPSTETRLALQISQDLSAEDSGWLTQNGLPNPGGLSTYNNMQYHGQSAWIQLQALGDDGIWYPYQGECTPNNSGAANQNGTYPTCFHPSFVPLPKRSRWSRRRQLLHDIRLFRHHIAPTDRSSLHSSSRHHTRFKYPQT